MFRISKLLLILFISETFAYITQNIETTLLPVWNPTDAEEIALTLKVFGKRIQLNLHRNDQIVSSTLKIWKHDAKDKTKEQFQLNASDSCYYHHRDHISSAVINFCHKYGLEGVIFLEDVTLEIMPLQNDAPSSFLIGDSCVKRDANTSLGKRHHIKRSMQLFIDSNFHHFDNFEREQRHAQNTQNEVYIELAVFLDEPAYKTFMPFLNRDEENEVFDLVITYVNGIQAVFHHPSLNVSIKISLSYMEIFQSQPPNLPHFEGDGLKLLDSFCKYANTYNPVGDDDSYHWDIGLYITGLDLYTLKGEERDFTPLGYSIPNGSCNPLLSCAVVEFGSNCGENRFFITKGFASIYVAAREIGHNLGIPYDLENSCPKGYIMSSVYDYQGKTDWSNCSRHVAKNLWQEKNCLRDQPDSVITNRYKITGLRSNNSILKKWTAKRQCELFFRDNNANVVTLHDACISLQCETPLKTGYYFTGPALSGTHCAPGRECRHGECKRVSNKWNTSSSNEDGSWTTWMKDPCKSHCLQKSKGVIVQRRYCRNGNDIMKNCKGPSYDVVLCDDSMFCNEKRKTIGEFIIEQCALYSRIINQPKFNAITIGSQGLYDDNKLWSACTVYCQVKNVTKFQNSRTEMLKKNIYPYLPDGTWCHVKNGQNYYCREHYCVPENYQLGQNW